MTSYDGVSGEIIAATLYSYPFSRLSLEEIIDETFRVLLMKQELVVSMRQNPMDIERLRVLEKAISGTVINKESKLYQEVLTTCYLELIGKRL